MNTTKGVASLAALDFEQVFGREQKWARLFREAAAQEATLERRDLHSMLRDAIDSLPPGRVGIEESLQAYVTWTRSLTED